MDDIKNKLILLKNIKPNLKKKTDFRNILMKELAMTKVNSRETWFVFLAAKLKPMPTMALVLTILIASGGVGAASASQDAIPGDTLYPLKITFEKMETAITHDETKKAELHLKFASRRLYETERVIEEEIKNADDMRIKNLLTEYQKELGEGARVTQENGLKNPEIADLLDQKTETNKKTIMAISKKLETRIQKNRSDEKLPEIMEEAREHTEIANDTASIMIFANAMKETQDKIDNENNRKITRKSDDKLRSAKNKITETKKQIERLKDEGYETDDAEKRLEEAANLLKNAETAIEKETYQESLLQSIQARQRAKEAEELAKKADQKRSGEEKDLKKRDNEDNNDD